MGKPRTCFCCQKELKPHQIVQWEEDYIPNTIVTTKSPAHCNECYNYVVDHWDELKARYELPTSAAPVEPTPVPRK